MVYVHGVMEWHEHDGMEVELHEHDVFSGVCNNVGLLAEHLPGRENGAADALSRGNRDLFFQQVHSSKKEPTAIPQVLLDVQMDHQPDWTSRTWRERCAATLQWV